MAASKFHLYPVSPANSIPPQLLVITSGWSFAADFTASFRSSMLGLFASTSTTRQYGQLAATIWMSRAASSAQPPPPNTVSAA